MELLRKNNTLLIDKEAVYALLLCQKGLLYPVTHLMNESEMQEVDNTGLYKNQSFPFSFILAPSGKRNQEVIQKAKTGDVILLICENKICGKLITQSTFAINKQERVSKIMGGDIYSQKAQNIAQRIDNYAICGEYELTLEEMPNLLSKEKILQAKKRIKARHITSIVVEASPITRIHERIFRSILEDLDLLVIFLVCKDNEELLDYKIRLECLEYVVQNYLPKERILIFPFEDIYLFAGSHGIILEAILSQNLGCERIVVGENYPKLALYYDNQKLYSIFDTTKDIKIKIKMLNELVYCNECKTIVSVKTCPHGKHHHISYHSNFIRNILLAGLIPPPILLRKEVSAKTLSYLFPNRFKKIPCLDFSILPNDGILEEYNEEKIYLKLLELYQTFSLN